MRHLIHARRHKATAVCLLLLLAITLLFAVACHNDPTPPVDTTGAGEDSGLSDTPSAGELTGESSEDPTEVPTEAPPAITLAPSGTDTAAPPEDTAADSAPTSLETVLGPIVPPLEPVDTDGSGTNTPAETKPYDPTLHPGDPALYDGVLIHMVYGTGKKGAEAVISHGFVQLYNSTDRDIALTGAALYYKTDNANPYEQFLFPEGAIIPAGGAYLVRAGGPADFVSSNALLTVDAYDAEWDIFIDNKEVRLLLAPAGWRIGKDENILLFDDANSVFIATESFNDSVFAVNDLSRNKIAVRTALKDYSGYHLVNLTRTTSGDLARYVPRTASGEVNSVAGTRLSEVTFSHQAGVYDKAFYLYLKAPDGYSIYYTTDGSDPSDAKNRNRQLYKNVIAMLSTESMPIGPVANSWDRVTPSVSKQIGGRVIKACGVSSTGATTPVYTNTYFISESFQNYGVPVVSISMPTEEIMGNGFYQNFLSGGSLTATRPRGVGIMEVFDPTGQRVGNSRVEMAVSGNGSSSFGMKSLRIYYKGINNQDGGLQSDLHYDLFAGRAKNANGEVITSFSRLLLRNSGNDCGTSYIRDAYMQRTCAGLKVDTMASATTLVFINGEFWGLYNARERYSPEYVESHYGIQKENVAIIESDYSQVHTNTNVDFVLSSGLEGDEDNFNALIAYMRPREGKLSDQDYAYICTQMDVDSFIDMWVTRLYYAARDWPENNIKVWRNRNPDDPSGFDTKWHFTLLDLDMGLSFYDFTTEHENFFWAFDSVSTTGMMMRTLMSNSAFKDQFIRRYYEVVSNHMMPDRLTAELEAMIAVRDPLMQLQVNRWGSDGASLSNWSQACTRMHSFVANRQPIALQQMYDRFGVSEDQLGNLGEIRVPVSYHDGRAMVTLNKVAVENGYVLTFENGRTVSITVRTAPLPGYVITGIQYVDRDGNVQLHEGYEATFEISKSGSITVFAKRADQNPAELSEGTIVAGATYMFYLAKNGDLYAWGDNRYGALGLGYAGGTVTQPTFVMSNVAKVFTSSANAYENGDTTFWTAVLTKDGRLLTVGRNTAGQLGRNGTVDSYEFGEIEFGGRVVDASAGHDHLLILDENGSLWGIGANNYGALGHQSLGGNVTNFVKIADRVDFMSAGRRSTVYVTEDGKLWGLGDNRWKKMSQQYGDQIHDPVVIAENIRFVDSGEHQIFAVDENAKLYYAGWRTVQGFNQGNGNNPTFAHMMDGVKKAEIYQANAVILTEAGDAYVYGLNVDGGIGNDAVTGGTPKKVQSKVADVAAGYGFTAYLMEDGRILILGDNTFGQAGNGSSGGRVNFAEATV